MRKEYVFTKEKREASHHSGMKMGIPIYLDTQISEVIEGIAYKMGVDRSTVVNEFLKKYLRKVETMK